MRENTLTQGNLFRAILQFSIPYLIASFLQTFYGMADLFITGQFNAAAQVNAVSIGSQVMHMFTVIVVGLAMGTTVSISLATGADNREEAAKAMGNSITVFTILAVLMTILLSGGISQILNILKTPAESLEPAAQYLKICFAGIPFIVAYNVISSMYRGLGDTKHPMVFVAIAGVFNIGLDYLLVGGLHMGAVGAAWATVTAQAASVVMALFFLRKNTKEINLSRQDLRPEKECVKQILGIGLPIACQDGLIQISFLVITMIANMRGLSVATAVGVVEKIISFLFLVPSAMLSTVSALTAQNIGAGAYGRGKQILRYAVCICVGFGVLVSLVCQFGGTQIVSLFVKNEPEVILYGNQYLRAYSLDCIFAGIHFCFSGYFSAYGKSMYSFLHNVTSILLVRIPGTYLASLFFPETLFPMGLAAPMGSLLSALICVVLYRRLMQGKEVRTN